MASNLNNQLQRAAKNGFVDEVKESIKHPLIALNCKDSDGRTPLHLATINVHREVVDILIDDPRLDPNAKDKYGKSSFFYAIHYDYGYETDSEESIQAKMTIWQLLMMCPKIDQSNIFKCVHE